MADDIRIKDLQSTASYMESDDYLPIDGLALGNRKIPFTGLMDSEDDRLPTTDKTPRGAITEHEEDISEIKQSLSDNKIGARVDISDYTSTQNLYVCPCDGFVGVDLTAAANAKCLVRIFGSDSLSNQISIGGWSNGTYGCYTCFVRKGMRLMTALVENNGKPFFIPITR